VQKQNLVRAHQELFRRSADEQFDSLSALSVYCRQKREASQDRWRPPAELEVQPGGNEGLLLKAGSDGAFLMNDWSFGQLCRLAGVGKETVNRLSASTAHRVFAETLPSGNKPIQLFTQGDCLRSIHGASYTACSTATWSPSCRSSPSISSLPKRRPEAALACTPGSRTCSAS
jgi:hypothetical protein